MGAATHSNPLLDQKDADLIDGCCTARDTQQRRGGLRSFGLPIIGHPRFWHHRLRGRPAGYPALVKCSAIVGLLLPRGSTLPEADFDLDDRRIARSRSEELVDDMDYAIRRQHVGELQSDAIHTHALCSVRDQDRSAYCREPRFASE